MKLTEAIILISTFCILSSHSQSEINHSTKNNILKNILVYRISKMKADIKTCSNGSPFNFKKILPSKNQELNVIFKKSNKSYPKKNIVLYEMKTDFSIINYTKYQSSLRKERIDIINFRESDSFNYDYLFLIGLNKLTNNVIYISGDFFKNCISSDFTLSIKKPNLFLSFLSLKLFSYEIRDIVFKKKKRNYLLFEGYSDSFISKVKIKVNRNNFDDITVEKCSAP